MHCPKNNSVCDYNIKNCFGFDEDNIDLYWHNSSVVNSTTGFLEFQENKPFRLALYVRPNDGKRLNVTNTLNNTKNKIQRSTSNKNENINNSIMAKFLSKSQSKIVKNNNKKNQVMLFDENTKPDTINENQKSLVEENKKEKDNNISKGLISSKRNVLVETNNKPINKSKQYRVRRSYERKCKHQKQEILLERASSDIIKELEIRKLSKTKPKKPSKEEQEFEKWAKDINSDFNDVDRFELSITYD